MHYWSQLIYFLKTWNKEAITLRNSEKRYFDKYAETRWRVGILRFCSICIQIVPVFSWGNTRVEKKKRTEHKYFGYDITKLKWKSWSWEVHLRIIKAAFGCRWCNSLFLWTNREMPSPYFQDFKPLWEPARKLNQSFAAVLEIKHPALRVMHVQLDY